jgi:hypothetical protein
MDVVIEVLEEDGLPIVAISACRTRITRVALIALRSSWASDADTLKVHEDLINLDGEVF